MKNVWVYVVGFLLAAASLIGLRRSGVADGEKKQAERQKAAADAVNKHLEKLDEKLDEAQVTKSAAIEREFAEIRRKIDAGGVDSIDANSLIDRTKGNGA